MALRFAARLSVVSVFACTLALAAPAPAVHDETTAPGAKLKSAPSVEIPGEFASQREPRMSCTYPAADTVELSRSDGAVLRVQGTKLFVAHPNTDKAVEDGPDGKHLLRVTAAPPAKPAEGGAVAFYRSASGGPYELVPRAGGKNLLEGQRWATDGSRVRFAKAPGKLLVEQTIAIDGVPNPRISVWDIEKKQFLQVKGKPLAVPGGIDAELTSDGRHLVQERWQLDEKTGETTIHVVVTDVTTGKTVSTKAFELAEQAIPVTVETPIYSGMSLLADGRTFLVPRRNGEIELYELPALERKGKVKQARVDGVTPHHRFSPDGSLAVEFTNGASTAKVIDTVTGAEKKIDLDQGGWLTNLCFTGDGSIAVLTSRDEGRRDQWRYRVSHHSLRERLGAGAVTAEQFPGLWKEVLTDAAVASSLAATPGLAPLLAAEAAKAGGLEPYDAKALAKSIADLDSGAHSVRTAGQAAIEAQIDGRDYRIEKNPEVAALREQLTAAMSTERLEQKRRLARLLHRLDVAEADHRAEERVARGGAAVGILERIGGETGRTALEAIAAQPGNLVAPQAKAALGRLATVDAAARARRAATGRLVGPEVAPLRNPKTQFTPEATEAMGGTL